MGSVASLKLWEVRRREEGSWSVAALALAAMHVIETRRLLTRAGPQSIAVPSRQHHSQNGDPLISGRYSAANCYDATPVCRVQQDLRALPASALRAPQPTLRGTRRHRGAETHIRLNQSRHLRTCRVHRSLAHLPDCLGDQQKLQPGR